MDRGATVYPLAQNDNTGSSRVEHPPEDAARFLYHGERDQSARTRYRNSEADQASSTLIFVLSMNEMTTPAWSLIEDLRHARLAFLLRLGKDLRPAAMSRGSSVMEGRDKTIPSPY